MEEIRYSGGKEICVALGVTILLALFLFRVEDSYRIGLLLVAGALLLLRPLPFRKWSRLDGCVAALALSDLFSCFYAACPIPALDAAFYSVYMLATYFVCRRLFAHGRALQVLRVGSLFPIGAALLLAVCSFFVFRSSVRRYVSFPFFVPSVGLHHQHLGRSAADGVRVDLPDAPLVGTASVFMPSGHPAFLFARCLCCTRHLSAFCTAVFPESRKTAVVAAGCDRHASGCSPLAKGDAHQQSTESRISGTAAAWQAFTERPFMGYGNGNYTYAVDAITGQDSTKPFTSIAPSLPVQLLVEKGICGTLVYLFAGIMIAWTLWQHRKKPDSRIIAATLLAVLVKDFAQATWLGTPVLLLMSYILPAYLQRDETLSAETDRTAYMVPAFAVALWVSWNIPSFRFLTDSTLDYLQDRNYDAACACHPEDVQLQYLYVTVLQPGVGGSRFFSSRTGRGTCRLCPLRLSGIYSRGYAAS